MPYAPVNCRSFLDLYSDYRDRRIDAFTRIRVLAHLGSCRKCERYDRVIRTGISVLRRSEMETVPLGSRRGRPKGCA